MKKVIAIHLWALFFTASGLAYAEAPAGWRTSGQHYDFGIDEKIFYSEPRSFYIKSLPGLTDKESGELYQSIETTEYSGKRMRISAYLKINNPIGSNPDYNAAGLWVHLRKDGERVGHGWGAIGKRDGRSLDWTKIDVVLDVPAEVDSIGYGFQLLSGVKADLWIDDISFEIVDQDVPIKGNIFKPTKPTNLP